VTRRRLLCGAGALAVTGALGGRNRAAVPRVVIAGAGFAGACCALQLRRLDPGIAVTLIDPVPTYTTCPMSNEAIVGVRSLQSLSVTRAGLQAAGISYRHDAVSAFDPIRHSVRLASGGTLEYERLVVAPGIRLLYGQPEGYDEAAARLMPHAWLAGTQTSALGACLRSTSDGATVAISVPGGLMRCPPAPYERASLMAWWLQLHRKRCKVLIFDANNHFPRQDTFTAAWTQRYPGMIEWIPPGEGGLITRVSAAQRTLYSASGTHRVALASVIPPQAPGTLALTGGLSSGHGWCPVKATTFESQLIEHVHVIGDACIAGAMPKSASAAAGQAQQCAAAIVTALGGTPPAPTELATVCYSKLAPEVALAIRGQFSLQHDEIRAVATADTAGSAPSAAAARDATLWYRQMRSSCFGI
jgi:NADPH-dependent 2,4-dienoyl-CoA reductase/sulfur reductase-like enzyme